MNRELPPMLRRIPQVFYILAVVVFLWNLGNQWFGIVEMGRYADAGLEGVVAIQKSQALYSAFVEAAYMLANGALVHILIKIFDQLKGAAE
jgi:hypothetical protein